MLHLPSGDLEELEPVGSGGFGLVYRGWSRTLGMTVALKTMHSSSLKDLMRELDKESNMMQKASNPHVLRLLAFYESEKESHIDGLVMEYMPHGSLSTLRQHIQEIPWALRFRIFNQIALGMNYLHCLNPPIIHRDLKPGNVLLNKYLDVQITDFGLSKISGATSSVKSEKSQVGTWGYVPPEAFTNINYKPTKAVDVYSFGILMWSVLSGEEPYNGICFQLIMHHVPRGQRPDLSVLDKLRGVSMVPEAEILMTSCWSGVAEERPTFHDCSDSTGNMFKEYEGQVDTDVQRVLASLKKIYSGDQIQEAGEDRNSNRILSASPKPFFKDDEPTARMQKPAQKGAHLPSFAQVEASPHNEDKLAVIPTQEISPKDAAERTFTATIKRSSDYNKVVKALSKEGLPSSSNKTQLATAQTLKDIGQPILKVFRNTIQNEPDKLVKGIAKLFK